MQEQKQATPNLKTTQRSLLARLVIKPSFWISVIIVLFGIPLYFSLRSPQPAIPPVLGKIENFKLTNEHGREVSYQGDYRGSVLLVNFIFTTCPDVCPLLTKQMSRIQSRIVGAAPVIKLVSISVDPYNDTPAKLLEYGKKYNANFKTWSFLTGDLSNIYDTVVNGFKMAMENPALKEEGTPVNPSKYASEEDLALDLMAITHGEHFVVVDQAGQIRAYMHARNNEQIDQIMKVLAIVANTRPPQDNSAVLSR